MRLSAKVCGRGHEMTPQNARIRYGKYLVCRACRSLVEKHPEESRKLKYGNRCKNGHWLGDHPETRVCQLCIRAYSKDYYQLHLRGHAPQGYVHTSVLAREFGVSSFVISGLARNGHFPSKSVYNPQTKYSHLFCPEHSLPKIRATIAAYLNQTHQETPDKLTRPLIEARGNMYIRFACAENGIPLSALRTTRKRPMARIEVARCVCYLLAVDEHFSFEDISKLLGITRTTAYHHSGRSKKSAAMTTEVQWLIEQVRAHVRQARQPLAALAR